jgi:hypothetical protein
MTRLVWGALATFATGVCVVQSGCIARTPVVTPPSDSEVATSVVSGALNNTSGSSVASNAFPALPRSTFERVVDAINPIGTAWAADWACHGGSLSPAFAGPGQDPYEFTPVSCSVTWGNGRTASSDWSGAFVLSYGASCDALHPFVENQAGGCTLTRTTAPGGDTRTITGPDGDSYAILHDTHGAGTGWDPSVTPAPTSSGVEVSCGSTGCAESRTVVVAGSHLRGTVTIDGTSTKIWDHTVSTGPQGVTVTGHGSSRVVTGAVTVQHNLLKYTATATFDSVGFAEVGCCFPTSGSVTTTFSDGPNTGKTETLTFSPICGEATLTTPSGSTGALTLQHCL